MSCGQQNSDCLLSLLGKYQSKPTGHSFCRVCSNQQEKIVSSSNAQHLDNQDKQSHQDSTKVLRDNPAADESARAQRAEVNTEKEQSKTKRPTIDKPSESSTAQLNQKPKPQTSVQYDNINMKVYTGVNTLTREPGAWLYVKEKTECSICMTFLDGLPYRSECCDNSFCQHCTNYYKELKSTCESLHCPHCHKEGDKFTLVENEWLGDYLLANKTAISIAMSEYSIKSQEIPDETFPQSTKIEEASKSLRYFWVRGPAIHIGRKPCKHSWESRRGHCVLDLRDQCIAYAAIKICYRCKIPSKTFFCADDLVPMARFASQLHIRHSGKKRLKLAHDDELTLQGLDNMLTLILTGALRSVTYAHWKHRTNYTMYGHDYWRS